MEAHLSNKSVGKLHLLKSHIFILVESLTMVLMTMMVMIMMSIMMISRLIMMMIMILKTEV